MRKLIFWVVIVLAAVAVVMLKAWLFGPGGSSSLIMAPVGIAFGFVGSRVWREWVKRGKAESRD